MPKQKDYAWTLFRTVMQILMAGLVLCFICMAFSSCRSVKHVFKQKLRTDSVAHVKTDSHYFKSIDTAAVKESLRVLLVKTDTAVKHEKVVIEETIKETKYDSSGKVTAVINTNRKTTKTTDSSGRSKQDSSSQSIKDSSGKKEVQTASKKEDSKTALTKETSSKQREVKTQPLGPVIVMGVVVLILLIFWWLHRKKKQIEAFTEDLPYN